MLAVFPPLWRHNSGRIKHQQSWSLRIPPLVACGRPRTSVLASLTAWSALAFIDVAQSSSLSCSLRQCRVVRGSPPLVMTLGAGGWQLVERSQRCTRVLCLGWSGRGNYIKGMPRALGFLCPSASRRHWLSSWRVDPEGAALKPPLKDRRLFFFPSRKCLLPLVKRWRKTFVSIAGPPTVLVLSLEGHLHLACGHLVRMYTGQVTLFSLRLFLYKSVQATAGLLEAPFGSLAHRLSMGSYFLEFYYMLKCSFFLSHSEVWLLKIQFIVRE